jgi:hypothetical protein
MGSSGEWSKMEGRRRTYAVGTAGGSNGSLCEVRWGGCAGYKGEWHEEESEEFHNGNDVLGGLWEDKMMTLLRVEVEGLKDEVLELRY